MTTWKRLLAKSSQDPDEPRPPERLSGHTAAVLSAADELLDVRLGSSLAAARLDCEKWENRLRKIVRLAALIHDLGKANDHFQKMVRRSGPEKQAMRHEAVSLWLSWPGQPLAEWLRAAVDTDDDYLCALVAAAGHHRKFWSRAFADDVAGAGAQLTLLTSHEDFQGTLRLGKLLGLSAPPEFTADLTINFNRRAHPERLFIAWERSSSHLGRGELGRVVGLAKALTLAADVAGSCVPVSGERPGWVRDALGPRNRNDALGGLVERRLKGQPPRQFQLEVASAPAPVVLVRAGCGSGKTVAAYLWAKTQHPARRLWVTYPTTGTATEGFRDYLFGADLDARLEHMRAAVDVEVFRLSDGAGSARERDRLDAIRVWGCDAVACTVDTVLGLIQNHRKSIYAWPSLANAAIVFDEVHAYDDGLFDALLHFLDAFPGIPALLMTASLPEARLQRLRDAVRRIHDQELLTISGPESLEVLPRYRLLEGGEPWSLVENAQSSGQKVLWVSNTVARCMANADEARERGFAPLVYHSRFRYVDRVERHGEVIQAFAASGAALALTTQVAEMSLDLSADLLISDLAPVPAMIQRLGRLNRRSSPEKPEPVKPFCVLPFTGQPYAKQELDDAQAWLQRLRGRDLAQKDLVDAWQPRFVEHGRLTPSTFRQGGFRSEVGELREPSPGVTVLMHEDAERVRRGEASALALALPMGVSGDAPRDIARWPRVQFYPVAPVNSIDYDARRGGQWRQQ